MQKNRNQKLASKFYGPYRIIKKIGEVAYGLELPDRACVHPTFHVSILKKNVRDQKVISSNISKINEEGQRVKLHAETLDWREKTIWRGKKTQLLIKWEDQN